MDRGRRIFQVTLESPGEATRSFPCGDDEYILDCASRNSIPLPNICRQGWCLTCAGILLEGAVDEHDAQDYLAQDRAAGFVLLCRGKPRSDVRIRTHQEDEMRRHRKALGLPAPYA